MNLTDLQFYKTLRKRNSEKSSTFTGILLPIANDINSFLQYVKNLFDTYTDHSIQHSFRILEYIYNVLDKMMINSITDTEIFCLIMAALFHDTGMALYNCTDKEEVRNKHHEFSTNVIDSYFEEKLKLLENSNRLKNVVIFVCRSHGFNIDDLYSNEEFLKNEKIDFQTVRYSLLSILLRIGDLMDIEENRTNSFILSLFGNKYSKESLDHNLRHRDIIT